MRAGVHTCKQPFFHLQRCSLPHSPFICNHMRHQHVQHCKAAAAVWRRLGTNQPVDLHPHLQCSDAAGCSGVPVVSTNSMTTLCTTTHRSTHLLSCRFCAFWVLSLSCCTMASSSTWAQPTVRVPCHSAAQYPRVPTPRVLLWKQWFHGRPGHCTSGQNVERFQCIRPASLHVRVFLFCASCASCQWIP